MATENPESKRKGGGGKLSRSETVTVRLDPRLRYLAELAARKHRRTLSSYIEWAVEESLTHVNLREESGDSPDDFQRAISLGAAHDCLWDVDEADRFSKLALQFPDLMTHDEQVLWKLVRENGLLWKGNYDKRDEWVWQVTPDALVADRLRDHFDTFKAVAEGKASRDTLPKWPKTKPAPPETDDDIPF
ncbi:MAG: hypothetical protein Q8L93_02285 [Rhodocyclaceae bacterium]|nr:hypothetical protein [Rhodocyclaceae bacterium]